MSVVAPVLEVAEVFRRHGDVYRQVHAGHLGRTEVRVMSAITACRTAALGGHTEACGDCGLVRIAYNSCRNRHCPKCQGLARAEWLADRQAELLPVPYFHVVFTVPTAVAAIAFQNKARVYAILFRAAAETLRTIAADPRHLGAEIGLVAVLHSWGQNLLHHPHVHCLVPGGGLSPDGTRWISCRPGFFLPVRVLSRLFRRLFLEHLQAEFEHLTFVGTQAAMADRSAFNRSLAELRRIDWVVFAKRPFAGPEQVLAYLGRYTHRVAIANSRLVTLAGDEVSFRWRDYRHHDKIKVMTLAADEFIRRFLLHTLPDGFHRIRHYGFLANGHRAAKLALCRHLLEAPTSAPPAPAADYRERYRQLTGRSLDICPVCGGRLIPLGLLPRAWCNRPKPTATHRVRHAATIP
ncbi:MAG: IS91 family transposase [Acetobacteraceae bacterium]